MPVFIQEFLRHTNCTFNTLKFSLFIIIFMEHTTLVIFYRKIKIILFKFTKVKIGKLEWHCF